MIRLDYYVRRKLGLDREEFRARWLQEHGIMWVKRSAALRG